MYCKVLNQTIETLKAKCTSLSLYSPAEIVVTSTRFILNVELEGNLEIRWCTCVILQKGNERPREVDKAIDKAEITVPISQVLLRSGLLSNGGKKGVAV